MAKYSQTFDFDVPYNTIWLWCENVAENYGWEIQKKEADRIVLREKGLIHLTHNRAKAEILVSKTTQEKTKLKISVSNFGLGLNSLFVNKIGQELSKTITEKLIAEKQKLHTGVEKGLVQLGINGFRVIMAG